MQLLNTGLRIHEHATIVLPADIARMMVGVVDLLPNPDLEYGFYLKGRWVPESATVEVAPGEYIFPRQETTPASIRFTEEPPGPEWNVVIHRHPQGCRSFSSTDRASINEEFLASILFIPQWEFPDAVVNIPIAPGSKFQTRARVRVTGGLVDVTERLRAEVPERLASRRRVALPGPGEGPVPAGRGSIEALARKPKILSVGPRPMIRGMASPIGASAEIVREDLFDHIHGREIPSPDLVDEIVALERQGFSADDAEDIAQSVRDSGLGINLDTKGSD